MKKDVKDISYEEAYKICEKYGISSISLSTQAHGGYNMPFGVSYSSTKGNFVAPLFYFRKPKNMKEEEYYDYLALFKYTFYQHS